MSSLRIPRRRHTLRLQRNRLPHCSSMPAICCCTSCMRACRPESNGCSYTSSPACSPARTGILPCASRALRRTWTSGSVCQSTCSRHWPVIAMRGGDVEDRSWKETVLALTSVLVHGDHIHLPGRQLLPNHGVTCPPLHSALLQPHATAHSETKSHPYDQAR